MPIDRLRNILVRGTNWIGDVIMTLPAMKSIRVTCPQAHIAVLAKPWVADVYRACPYVDEVILYQRPGEHEGLKGLWRLIRSLRAREFDAAILLQNAIEAAIIADLAGIPIRAGYDSDARGWLLTHAVRRTKAIRQVHQTDYYLELVRALGFKPVEKDCQLQFGTEFEDLAGRLRERFNLGSQERLIGMAPGAAYGPAKKWPAERFASVATELQRSFPTRIVLFGSGSDRLTTERIAQAVGPGAVNIAGETSLQEAMALIAQCTLFISNDSGLMHVAGALGVPTIAIFGSTNPVTTSPTGPRCTIIRKELSCSPCLKKECPTDFQCMTAIKPEEVIETARHILEAAT